MINEEDIIHTIQTDYMANIPKDCYIQSVPRDIPLNQFNLQQKIALDLLFDPKNNLHLDILFKDISSHQRFEYTDEYKNKISQNPSQFIIESISFKLASAFIFISLYYQDEVHSLSNQITFEKSINQSHVIIAIIIAMASFFSFISFHEQFNQLIRFSIFAIGLISIAYLYEIFKNKNSKNKITENQLYIAQYLAIKLEQFSTQQLELDSPQFHE